MKNNIRIKSIFAVILSVSVTEVTADWTGCRILDNDCVDYQIADIFRDVDKVNKDLLKNRPVLDLYINQKDYWKAHETGTLLITDGIVDVLEKLPPARDEFLDFIGSPKCHPGSECYQFQNALIGFFDELTALNKNLPAFERAGLGDKNLVANGILTTPPILLYALYRGMKKIPEWESLPSDLREIYEEIDDPEVFQMGWRDSEGSNGADTIGTQASVSRVALRDSTKTQRFCAKRADKFDGTGRGPNGNRDGWDQIRINRITLYLTFLSDSWAWGLDQVPDDVDIGVSLVGEGGYLGIPTVVFTWMFKIVPHAMNSVLKAVEVHHKNIDLCKSRYSEIEGRLSSCGYFSEFVLDEAARGEYYDLVRRRFEMADVAGIPHTKSDRFFDTSETKLGNGQYEQAYQNLCEAYKYIGVAR